MCQRRRTDHHLLTPSRSPDAKPRAGRPRSIALYPTTTGKTRPPIRCSLVRPVRAAAKTARSRASAPRRWRLAASRSVLASISTLFRDHGRSARRFRARASIPSAPHPELHAMVHRWTRGRRSCRAALDPAADAGTIGIGGAVLRGGLERRRRRRWPCARHLFAARAGARHAPGLRPRPEARRRLLLFPAAVGGQRLQAAQPVPALDGARRCSRSGRVADGSPRDS